jgi:hypothetical protein
MEFDKIIDTLIYDISNLNNSIENTNAPVSNTKITITNNTLTRDQYTMESIQRKQDYINYKRDIKKNLDDNKVDYAVVSNDDLMNVINLLDYNKTWTRLDKYQKKKKLIEYINSLIDSNSLDSTYKTDLLKELQTLIFSKKMKSSSIQYDIKSQTILDIKGLVLNNKSYSIK